MEIKELLKKIKPDKNYSLKGIMKLGVFEHTLGFKSYQTCLKFILKDNAQKGGIFKATIVGEGRQTVYILKGKNIINFLKMYETKNATKNEEDND